MVTKERLRLIVLKLLILNLSADVITNIPPVICIVNSRYDVYFAGKARRIISPFLFAGVVAGLRRNVGKLSLQPWRVGFI